MNDAELRGALDFLRNAERLKTVTRSAYTSTGQQESVAEHTWRVALMAALFGSQLPDVDELRLIRVCLVHDLGEAIGGDIRAPEQACRRAEGAMEGKSAAERRDLETLLEPLPQPMRDDFIALWDEYEAAETPTARVAKSTGQTGNDSPAHAGSDSSRIRLSLQPRLRSRTYGVAEAHVCTPRGAGSGNRGSCPRRRA